MDVIYRPHHHLNWYLVSFSCAWRVRLTRHFRLSLLLQTGKSRFEICSQLPESRAEFAPDLPASRMRHLQLVRSLPLCLCPCPRVCRLVCHSLSFCHSLSVWLQPPSTAESLRLYLFTWHTWPPGPNYLNCSQRAMRGSEASASQGSTTSSRWETGRHCGAP